MSSKQKTILVGAHALVWVGEWSETKARTAIESTKTAGFDLIEVPVMDPSAVDARMTKRILDEVGLRASCSLGLTFDADISSEDPRVVSRGRDLLKGALEVAVGIEATFLGGITYSAMGKYAAPATERGRANAAAVLRELAGEAATEGISIGLEVVNRYETNLLNTCDEAIAFANQIGAENILVQLDTYHMNIEESDLRGPVLRAADAGRLAYVHVGENHRGYLGSGSIDFPDFFRALAEVDYTGVVTFESFSSTVVSPELTLGLSIWRNLWSDGMDLASHARQFIDAEFTAAQRAQR